MIRFHFHQEKATQAMAVLLRRAGEAKTENYLKLLKILYYADRESLSRTGRPITGDKVFALDHGPVLSNVLDLIRDRTFGSEEWARAIVTEHTNIRLVCDPGNDELSPFEIDILHEVWERYKDVEPFELVERTHALPEYKKNKPPEGSRREIPFEDILDAVGRHDVASVKEDADELAALNRLYGA